MCRHQNVTEQLSTSWVEKINPRGPPQQEMLHCDKQRHPLPNTSMTSMLATDGQTTNRRTDKQTDGVKM